MKEPLTVQFYRTASPSLQPRRLELELHAAAGALTYQNEPGGLEELLVVPLGVLALEYVADAVVLAQPDRGVHHQPRHQPKHLLPHGELQVLGHVGWVQHLCLRVPHRRRVHLSIDHLCQGEKTGVVSCDT